MSDDGSPMKTPTDAAIREMLESRASRVQPSSIVPVVPKGIGFPQRAKFFRELGASLPHLEERINA